MQHGPTQAMVPGSLLAHTVATGKTAIMPPGPHLRSRIPRKPTVEGQPLVLNWEERAKLPISQQTLRRRRQSHAVATPLRERYESENGKQSRQQTSLRQSEIRSKSVSDKETSPTDIWFASEAMPARKNHVEQDVEKGVANLDGQTTAEREDDLSNDADRVTFAAWEASSQWLVGDADSDGVGVALSPIGVGHDQGRDRADEIQSKAKSERTVQEKSSLWWEDIPFSVPHYPPSIASVDDHCCYPEIEDPKDPARRLSKRSLYAQRMIAALTVVLCNAAPLIAYFESHRHLWVLIFIVFVKAKDVLSTFIAFVALSYQSLRPKETHVDVPPKTIISLITVSFETEDQIMKTLDSMREADLLPHRQIFCLILDGGPKPNIHRKIVKTRKAIRRPYVTWLYNRNEVTVDCGYFNGTPIIYIQKTHNEGKKDSLILCHDLFNHVRSDVPLYTKLLREEIWSIMMPTLTGSPDFAQFDNIFCTDADSIIHKDAQRRLLEELHKDKRSIAACGVLFAELDYRTEWSIWSLFQQFQYSYGQIVRRQAEGIWGRVTCLPGCITMITVRPEMAGAIREYAKPVTDKAFWRHQVQYLGTDRRLTYSMLSQSKDLKTLFVPDAISETVCPQSLRHYLNQRRRWGSNAYFNDYFYFLGGQQYLITRIWAFIDISRMTFVYYRQANNILFLYGLARNFSVIKIVPLLIVTQTPTIWFLILVLTRHPLLRQRIHKLVLGLLINYLMSPILSIVVFSRMIVQLGSAGITWNNTGACTAKPDPTLRMTTPRNSWSSARLSSIVRSIFLGECVSSEYDGEAHPVKVIPEVPHIASYPASIAETMRSNRTARTSESKRSAKLPAHLRSQSHERPRRRRQSARSQPLHQDGSTAPNNPVSGDQADGTSRSIRSVWTIA